MPGDTWLEQDVDVLIPAAVENQINAASVSRVAPRVRVVAEGALIAGFAMRARAGYIYIRGEFIRETEVLP